MKKDLNSLSSLKNVAAKAQKPVAATEVPIDKIRTKNNVRTEFFDESIQELANSIQSDGGVLVPISVREDKDQPGYYIVNHGERRLRASILLGLPTIPATLDNRYLSAADSVLILDQIIENESREGLTVLDIGRALNLLMDEEGMTVAEIKKKTGKDDSWISRHIKVVDAPDIVKDKIISGQINSAETAATLTAVNAHDAAAVQEFLNSYDDKAPITQQAVRDLAREKGKGKKKTVEQVDKNNPDRIDNRTEDWVDQFENEFKPNYEILRDLTKQDTIDGRCSMQLFKHLGGKDSINLLDAFNGVSNDTMQHVFKILSFVSQGGDVNRLVELAEDEAFF